ncbi:protein kinase domain-containing protein [Legionella hackeliae]|uniref:Serine/threonine-protein kinase n=1 Tax=Legionella hackeliae TaxID=449 RepID=A0A0A8UYU7_LEGHA|nr:serine/threonine-protein kinase [Legionella hackeliae]KTD12525.1 Protein kinase domain protein [Legionella hackeliae]CEK11939.1 Serine/threonine-protein kinase [Legionella hackeliae]STX48713.1 Protein kinase domain [Legionella hackeliae]
MGESTKENKGNSSTVFPVTQSNGKIIYFFSDFSETLGSGGSADVYKGYRCELKNPKAITGPSVIDINDVIIQHNNPVAIKLYKPGYTPSPYRKSSNSYLPLEVRGRMVLIMKFVEGFHINPAIDDNPEIKSMTFFQAVDAAWQLVIGLNPLHYRNSKGTSVVHGDIKGSNVKIKIVKEAPSDDHKPAKTKIDVEYLDDDYSKPILAIPQIVQGTPEHLALELLDGDYSELSDFYALGPLLLSIFGAKNPFKTMLEFRDNHPAMGYEGLVKHYAELGYNPEGLFGHFKEVLDNSLCELLKKFLLQMVAREKALRPSSDAILEFFTALRQKCLFTEQGEDASVFSLRMRIAAGEATWLEDKSQRQLFYSLDQTVQNRLIHLLGPQKSFCFYELCTQDKALNQEGISNLIRVLLKQLIENKQFNNSVSQSQSFFKSPVMQKELQWLLSCYEEKNWEAFFSKQGDVFKNTLKQAPQEIIPLITIVVEQLTKEQSHAVPRPAPLSQGSHALFMKKRPATAFSSTERAIVVGYEN